MQTTESIWYNGKLIPWDDAKIHVLTHTLHYGGGAFEGIRFYKTNNGPAIFRLKEHVDRLFYSADALKMAFPYSKEEIMQAIKDTVRVNNIESGYVRPIIFFGYGKMGVNPVGAPVDIAIACWPWGAYLPHESVDIKTSNYIRIHPRSSVIDAKLCGHYVNGILANLEIKGTPYHEVLFLDDDGLICEGTAENFFMVKDDVIYTPKLGSILAGITRDTIVKLARKLGYEVVEKDLRLDDAYQAEEAFFTGTAAEVTLIRSIDDKVLKHSNKSEVGKKIKQAYLDLVHGKDPDFAEYLAYL